MAAFRRRLTWENEDRTARPEPPEALDFQANWLRSTPKSNCAFHKALYPHESSGIERRYTPQHPRLSYAAFLYQTLVNLNFLIRLAFPRLCPSGISPAMLIFVVSPTMLVARTNRSFGSARASGRFAKWYMAKGNQRQCSQSIYKPYTTLGVVADTN
jgi:hypothetical protein